MELIDVPQRHQFNIDNLYQYLVDQLGGFKCTRGNLTVRQFTHGESNPTFLIQTDSGQKYVLRKQPFGDLLLGAHRVDREYQVISALYSVGFPVPRPYLICTDTHVIGASFYVMEYVVGRIFRDASLPGVSPEERRLLYKSLVETLAQLHCIDWNKLGLQDFGGRSKRSYCERQISVWSNNYRMSCIDGDPLSEMERLMKWLPENIPPTPHPKVIIHGDYRPENVIFHPTEPRVIAVLDWELSTLGHPLVDVAHLCMVYLTIPGKFTLNNAPGAPDETTLTEWYCKAAGIPHPLENWPFFRAMTTFRMAAIAQGVYARGLHGNASSESTKSFKHSIKPLAISACSFFDNSIKQPALPSYLDFVHYSDEAKQMLLLLKVFMEAYIYPAEKECYEHITNPDKMWTIPPIMEELKEVARLAGLWNLFLPGVSGLSQLEYAPMAEEMGRSPLSSEVFNCSAPDTGNMEVLYMYGSEQQKEKWLKPLLEGKIRSCFSMTEPNNASSDATNIECTIKRIGDEYEINGLKWWSSGAGDPRCKVAIVMGKTNPDADRLHQHSMILVPLDTPGVKKIRPLSIFGYLDAPHGHLEIDYDHVRVPAENLILGEGRGFEIAQGRLGPGRIHHCMRLIGMAERAVDMMCSRAIERKAFGKRLVHQQTVRTAIAESRLEIDQCRLLVLNAAHFIDTVGIKGARKQIAAIKVAVPQMACRVIDRAIQLHGALGVSQDSPLAHLFALARCLRIADGPDIVHLETVAKLELKEKAKL